MCAYIALDRSRFLTGIMCTVGMFASLGTLFTSEWILTSSFLFGACVYACINIWGIISTDMVDQAFTGRCSAFVNFISNSFAVFAGSPLAWLISTYGYSVLSTLSVSFITLSLSVYAFRWNVPLHIKGETTR
ncbi:unnamed protein product [Anisakis simplex]|uniref:Uncharacterized protein n=1 Tax=Anisakis simplex TaxID=6269 RepID=A0A3P6NN19_ANISI|nr:unnamed protein product [Anisakis simplex]